MASLISSTRLGNASTSSLLKSAAGIANQLATYQDNQMKDAYAAAPTADNMNAYISYLNGRIATLNANGSVADLNKALSMTQEIKSAVVKNATFTVDYIHGQMLAGNASDQTILDFINNQVLNNPVIQQDPATFVKYQNESYNLQQSIEYHNQVAGIAAQVQASNDLAAQERGYANGKALIDAAWQNFKDAYSKGQLDTIDQALQKSADELRQKYGVNIPKGEQGDYSTVHLGNLIAKAAYLAQSAEAAGPNNPDYTKYVNEVQSTLHSQEFATAVANSMASSNLLHPVQDSSGNITPQTNAITGYQTHDVTINIPGLGPQTITVNIPQTNGTSQTPWTALNSVQKSMLLHKLEGLGADVPKNTTSSSTLHVTFSDKFLSSLGINKNSELGKQLDGANLELIPTAKGFEFAYGTEGNHYGISFDRGGVAALFQQVGSGAWNKVASQQGYNPANNSIASISSPTQAMSTAFRNFFSGGPAAQAARPSMVQRAGGGFNFTNASGQAISAAKYAALTGTPFRNLLTQMANQGDAGAKAVLPFVGNDYGYDPTKIGSNAGLYNSMVYGQHALAPQGTAPNTMSIKSLGM